MVRSLGHGLFRRALVWSGTLGTCLVLSVTGVQGQVYTTSTKCKTVISCTPCPPVNCPPATIAPPIAHGVTPTPSAPLPATPAPLTPAPTPAPATMPTPTPAPTPAPVATSTPVSTEAAAAAVDPGALRASAVGRGYFTGTGYIDSAIPVTQFRLRYDTAYGNNRPDRAEFFYPKCGCFAMLPPGNALFDPRAKGPPVPGETNVDYQDIRPYLEWAVCPNFSIFGEVPVRWINPDLNANASGLGDVMFGAKYAVIYNEDTVVSLQAQAYAPTGDPRLGLSTSNWVLEPGVLLFQRLGESIFLEAEVRDIIPLDSQTNFGGNVLRYGVGLSYLLYNTESFRIAPVVEFVGWTVLSGRESTPDANLPVVDATGITVINAKLGVRIGFGQANNSAVLNKSDLYIGYGRALTGDVWYQDMLRVEWRYRF